MRQLGMGMYSITLVALVVLFAVPTLSASTATVTQHTDTIEQTDNSGVKAENSTWIHLEATPQAAYVGIHGGTAPITLVRTKNGELVALTGETGSDFTRLLLGHNASRNNSDAAPSTSAREAAPYLDEYSGFGNLADTDEHHIQTAPAPKPEQAAPVTREQSPKKETRVARQSPVVLPDSIAEKPGNYPSPVFVNEHGTPSLDAHESLGFYGMSLADNPPAILVAQAITDKTLLAPRVPAKPLVLNDYRRLLSLR